MLLAISILIAKSAGFLSRTLLRKSGETIPGRVLLKLQPDAITTLSKDRKIIIVSATNGKTSTTRALTKLVSKLGSTVSNSTGSNLNWGAATTLMSKSEYAVLEVDELHLTNVAKASAPDLILLLNLTRDQLHRMHEVKRVADRWHKLAEELPNTLFVGDIDDPFVAYALRGAVKKIKVSFGGRKHEDGAVCPSCGQYLNWIKNDYECSCGLTNKSPDQEFPNASAAIRNANLANVAGVALGAKPNPISESDLERSVVKNFAGVEAKFRLTKNPASWREALAGVKQNQVLLVLNARQVDGIDTSWLWDVTFESLAGKEVVVTGDRALDMAYRLHVQGINAKIVKDFSTAIATFDRGTEVDVLAAYTAFFELVGA
jgi:UDP-N-acetylmuramyl tripeptide synthase